MSDTPETDAALYPMNGVDIVWPDFARKLERGRDEARRECKFLWDERDEARAEIQRLRLDAQREAEQHDRMVKELEGLYDQLAKTKPSNEHICSLSKDLMGNCIICDG